MYLILFLISQGFSIFFISLNFRVFLKANLFFIQLRLFIIILNLCQLFGLLFCYLFIKIYFLFFELEIRTKKLNHSYQQSINLFLTNVLVNLAEHILSSTFLTILIKDSFKFNNFILHYYYLINNHFCLTFCF